MKNFCNGKSCFAIFMLPCLFFFPCFFNPLQAQLRLRESKITDEQIERLKTKTVVLILPSSQYDYLEDYKATVPKAWTVTPIEVVKFSDVADYVNPEKYAIFGISAVTSSGSYTNSHYWLSLSVPYQKESRKKTSTEYDNLCRIDLYPDRKTQDIGAYKDAYSKLYEGSVMRNFTLPYILT